MDSSFRTALAGLILLTASCATYNDQTEVFRNAWDTGDLDSALDQINSLAERAPKKDQIVVRLEQATTSQTVAAAYDNQELSDMSYGVFELASQLTQEFFPDSNSYETFKVRSEAIGNVVNLGETPYRSYVYDRIMMDTYLLLHKLQRNEIGKIRPGFNELKFKQDSAEQFFSKQIASDRKKLEEHEQEKDNYKVSKALSDDAFGSNVQESVTQPSTAEDFRSLPDFFNPIARFLDGIYFLHNGKSFNERDQAKKNLESISGFISGSIIKEIVSKNPGNEFYTYVMVESGYAPMREEVRIDIPVFMFAETHVPYAGAAFPKLSFRQTNGESFFVKHGEETKSMSLLANFDTIISREFNKRFPGVMKRVLASAGTKIMAQYIANKVTDEVIKKKAAKGEATFADYLVQGIVKVGGAAYAAGTTRADLRTWTTLPKTVHVARVKTPTNGSLLISGGQYTTPVETQVTPAKNNIVYSRALKGLPSPLILFNITL
ncbi:MAG: hypothetical protein HOI70_06590 [Opitutae bacterium]|nr:hypothetical protein [Opitutae bacterium]